MTIFKFLLRISISFSSHYPAIPTGLDFSFRGLERGSGETVGACHQLGNPVRRGLPP